MAKLVAAFGAAHHPSFPVAIANAPGTIPDEGLYRAVREHLERAEPNLIIELTTDHFTNFPTRICRPSASASSSRRRAPSARSGCRTTRSRAVLTSQGGCCNTV